MEVFFEWIGDNPGRFILYLGGLSWLSLGGVLPGYGEIGFWSRGARVMVSGVIGLFGSFFILGGFIDSDFEMLAGFSIFFAAAAVYVQRPWRW